MDRSFEAVRRGTRWSAGGVLLALGVLFSSGCGDILEVELPGETPADALDDPSFATLLTVSSVGAFECAYTNYALLSGLIAGELIGSQTFLNQVPYQRRDVRPLDASYSGANCESSTGLHVPLSTARFMADDSFERISAFSDADVPRRTELLATNALIAGYSYTVFGEGWCSSAFDLGPELQPTAMLELGVERFTTAIELAGQIGDDEVLNAAYVGRARARLGLGQSSGALEDAQRVPEGFEFLITRSAAADERQNKIYRRNHPDLAVSVDPDFWNVEWEGAPDPRVQVTDDEILGQDGLTPMWRQQKYTSDNAPVRLASYVEARLVEAEVSGGQTAVDIVNELLEAAGLDPSFSSSDPDEIREQVLEQRRREFFLEGHRMGDLRRTSQITDVTSGRHPFVGDAYGGMQCFPLPDTERQANPNVP